MPAVVTGLLVWLTAASSGAGEQVEKMTPVTATAIRSWVEAVKTHVPGRVDAPLVTGGQAFLRATRRAQRRHGVLSPHPRRWELTTPRETERRKRSRRSPISRGPRRRFLPEASRHSPFGRGGVHRQLPSPERCHGTTADPEAGRSRSAAAPVRTAIELEDSVPPLLTASRLVLHNDGQVLNEDIASWNWPFARRLLDLLGVDKRRGEPNRARVAGSIRQRVVPRSDGLHVRDGIVRRRHSASLPGSRAAA